MWNYLLVLKFTGIDQLTLSCLLNGKKHNDLPLKDAMILVYRAVYK